MHRKPIFLLAIILLFVMLFLSGCGGGEGDTLELTLSMSSNPVMFEQVGETITYTYTVTNTGNLILFDIVVTTEAGDASCPAAQIEPGASMDCTSIHTVTDTDYQAGSIVVDGFARGVGEVGGYCGCSGQDQGVFATASLEVKPNIIFKLSMTKTSDVSTYSELGQQITYTYTIENTGNQDFTETISVQDDRLQVTCPEGGTGLVIGETLVCTGTYTVTVDDLRAGEIMNTAVALAGTVQSDPVSLSITVDPQPSLALEKTASPTAYETTGETITYSFIATNTGNVPLTELVIVDAKVTDIVCPELINGEIAPGESVTCTGTYIVALTDTGRTITNSAGAHAKFGDVTIPSNVVSADVTYIYVPEATEPPQTNLGDICYTITDVNACLALYPLCTTDSYTEQCKPGP